MQQFYGNVMNLHLPLHAHEVKHFSVSSLTLTLPLSFTHSLCRPLRFTLGHYDLFFCGHTHLFNTFIPGQMQIAQISQPAEITQIKDS